MTMREFLNKHFSKTVSEYTEEQIDQLSPYFQFTIRLMNYCNKHDYEIVDGNFEKGNARIKINEDTTVNVGHKDGKIVITGE